MKINNFISLFYDESCFWLPFQLMKDEKSASTIYFIFGVFLNPFT